MVRKNRLQGLRLKRGRTQKIVPSKKGTVPRKEAYKSLRISTIGSVIQLIKFFLKKFKLEMYCFVLKIKTLLGLLGL